MVKGGCALVKGDVVDKGDVSLYTVVWVVLVTGDVVYKGCKSGVVSSPIGKWVVWVGRRY